LTREAHGRLQVAIVGAGDISQYHLRAWRKAPAVDVVAICDVQAARASDRAAAFGIPRAYSSAAEMFGRESLDAVDIATWRETHVELVRLAARHGVDVLCQKPLAATLAEAEALVSEVRGRIRLMVHENRRWAPQFRRVRAWIDAGDVGEVLQCVWTMHRSGLLKSADGKRAAAERAPYMATEKRLLLAEVFIHQLDVLRFLLGPLHVVAARAKRTDPELPGETLASLMLETAAGFPVTLAGSFVAPGFGSAVADRLDIIGSRSSVLLDQDRLEIRGNSNERCDVDAGVAYQTCFDSAIAHFVESIRTGSPFETDAVDNLETLRLVERAYELAAG
jgi:predicted dehydrogenase